VLNLTWFIPAMLLLTLTVGRWRSAWTYVRETVTDWLPSRQGEELQQEL